jgi:ABC-type nitrate/sulfonate/bicarbonate transport system substrate-binding protein
MKWVLLPILLAMAACGPAAAPAATSPAGSTAAAASARPGASAASPPASGLIKLKAAYSQVTSSQGVLYTAVEQKFFERYGLEVDASQVGGTQQPPAMQAGEVQFGTPGGNELISASVGGVPMVMIASATNVPVVSLWGAKGINDVKDLAGKTIAVTSIGSATDAAAQIFLQQYGLNQQVKRQAAGTSEAVLAVVLHGDAAAGLFAPPTSVEAERSGLKELINGPKSGVPFVQSGVSVTQDYLKSNPDIVKRYLQGYYDAWKFCTDPANEAAVEQTLAKWTKSDLAAAKVGYDYLLPAWKREGMPMVSIEGLKSIAAISDNPKARGANVSQFVDNSLLESLGAGKPPA